MSEEKPKIRELRRPFMDGLFRATFSMEPYDRMLFELLMPGIDPGEITDITMNDDGMTTRMRNDLGLLCSNGYILLVEMQLCDDWRISYRVPMYIMNTRRHHLHEMMSNGNLKEGFQSPRLRAFVIYMGARKPSESVKWSRDSVVDGGPTDDEFTAEVINLRTMYSEWKAQYEAGLNPESNVLIDYARVRDFYQEHKHSPEAKEKDGVLRFIQKCINANLFVDMFEYLLLEYGDNMEAIYKLFDDEEEMIRCCRNEGVEIGIEKGRESEKRDIVLEMLKRGFNIEEIASIIKLPVEAVEKMQAEAGL
ncbi:MAG: hypothetical protein II434_08965 [Bacteroidales bacterium]|nr:hypothetical protein [Bacteroidales bacterium]